MNSLAGYPNFMQSLSNPMQSGLNWSSFGKLMQGNQNLTHELKNIRKRSAASMFGSEPQNPLLKIQEQLGNITQQLGVTLPTGAVDMRQVLQGGISQPLVTATNAPNTRQILQEIYPGLNAYDYCRDYCAKKKLQMQYVPTQTAGMSYAPFTFILNVQVYNGGPILQTSGTDMTKMEAKQRAAEQMIPKLLQLIGPMQVTKSHFQKSSVESHTRRFATSIPASTRRTRSRPARSKISAITSDEEWVKYVNNLGASGNNPTSILYAWAQRKRLDVPKYEIVSGPLVSSTDAIEAATPGEEDVTQEVKKQKMDDVKAETPEGEHVTQMTEQKIEEDASKMYTIRCTFQGKEFTGDPDMDKKKAKMNASALAWKEFCPK